MPKKTDLPKMRGTNFRKERYVAITSPKMDCPTLAGTHRPQCGIDGDVIGSLRSSQVEHADYTVERTARSTSKMTLSDGKQDLSGQGSPTQETETSRWSIQTVTSWSYAAILSRVGSD